MKWKPLYDKIVIELNDKQEVKTSSGLTFIQDASKSNYTVLEGTVRAVGEGRLLQDGTIVKPIVEIGDKVKFSKLQGESFIDEEDEKEYTIISESNILAFRKGE